MVYLTFTDDLRTIQEIHNIECTGYFHGLRIERDEKKGEVLADGLHSDTPTNRTLAEKGTR